MIQKLKDVLAIGGGWEIWKDDKTFCVQVFDAIGNEWAYSGYGRSLSAAIRDAYKILREEGKL